MVRVIITLFVIFSISPGQTYQSETLTSTSKIIFSDSVLAVNVITTEDEYTRLISSYEKSAGMKTNKPVSYEEYITHCAKNVMKWAKGEVEMFSSFTKRAGQEIKELNLNLPDEIILIKTTSEEFGGVTVAYTRQNAIFFTEQILSSPRLYDTFIHEIFHIYSRHNPLIREKLYTIIGFHQANEIRLPKEWNEKRITNPDAPALNTIIDLDLKGETITMTPLIFAQNPVYDTTKPGGIFQSMSFQLMAVEENEGNWQPIIIDGNPVLYNPGEVEDYFNKIGRNTNYIIHPEEIMAANFEFLVLGSKDLPNPEIIEKFREVLSSAN